MAEPVHLLDLTKTFDDIRAVDHITLTIEPGELFFLLGPSGCGKTTLLRSIAGFYTPDSGSIRIGDRDITNLPPHQRDTGMVFQSYALWPHMSVRENVAFGLQMRKVSKEETAKRVDEALAMVKMTDRADYKPNQLSGGQQQRVALARALVIHPTCLLLDEPLSNLDAKLRLDMRAEIRRICKEAELTAIYVTHDQKEALSIADRLAVLDDGIVQQCGTPQEVYRRPANTFTANFIGETNFLEGDVTGVEDGAITVKTALGDLVSSADPVHTLEAGAHVKISLRPECIGLGEAAPDQLNRFEGDVHHTMYLGEVAQHMVTVHAQSDNGESHQFKAFELNPKIVARDKTERASVWFAPENVVLLKQ